MFEHFKHHTHLISGKNAEINEIYLNLMIRGFALSLIGLFIPIYLLSLNYSLQTIITLFLIPYHIAFVLSVFPAAWIAKRFGVKHCVLIGTPLVILNVVLFYVLNFYTIPLYVITIVGGVGSSIYWVGIHSDFSKNTHRVDVTKKASFIFSLPVMASMLGPLFGGLIISYYSYEILLIVSMSILMASVIPLFKTKDFKQKTHFSLRKLLKVEKKYFFAFFSQGARLTSLHFFWPLFVFFSLENPVGVGIMGTLVQIMIAVLPIIITKLHKKIRLHCFMWTGAIFYFILMMFSSFMGNTFLFIATASLLLGMVNILIDMPYYAINIQHSKNFKPVEWAMFREFSIHFGSLIVSIIGLVAFNYAFISSGVFTLAYLLI